MRKKKNTKTLVSQVKEKHSETSNFSLQDGDVLY